MIHAFERLNAEPVRGVLDARAPFFSFDGRWLGFFEGQELKRDRRFGWATELGMPVYRKRLGVPTWGPDDTIVFATSDRATGLFSVRASGGEPRAHKTGYTTRAARPFLALCTAQREGDPVRSGKP